MASPLENLSTPASPAAPSPKPRLTAKQQAEKQALYLERKERENLLAGMFLQLYVGKLREIRYFERWVLLIVCERAPC